MTTASHALFDAARRVPILQVLEWVGALEHLRRSGRDCRGPCPLCGTSKTSRAFVVTPATNQWRCFACDTAGDTIRLIELLERCPAREAAARLVEKFCPPRNRPSQRRPAMTDRNRRPTLKVLAIATRTDADGNSVERLTEIGAAWPNSKGGYGIRLDALPLQDRNGECRIVLLPYDDKRQPEPAA